MKSYFPLNAAQEEAVRYLDNNVLIIAGAGSGKTRVITEKFIRLVKEKKISPYSIIAITFTNRAASEMQSRINAGFHGQYPSLNIRTFHSFGAWLLRIFIEDLGYGKNFSIIDSDDQIRIIKEMVKNNLYAEEIDNSRFYVKFVTRLKNDLYGYEDDGRELPDDYYLGNLDKEELFLVYRLYQEYLKSNNLLDFDDLLLLSGKLLESSPLVKSFVRDRYRYLLVDEYQDTNRAQEKMIEAMSKLGLIISAVGDEDQCIYSFRGSRIENIHLFEERYKDVKVVKLEENYRSTQNILKLANEIISMNQRLYPKELYTQNEEGSLPKLRYFIQKKEESAYLLKEIKRYKDEGYQYHDMAILYRLNSVSRFVEEELIRSFIPYEIYGDVKFYKRKEIKDVLSYLIFLFNPRDMNAFSRIVNYPKRSLGDKTQEKIIGFIADHTSPSSDFLKEYEAGLRVEGLNGKAKENFHDFMMNLISLRKEMDSLKVDEIIHRIIEDFHIEEDLEKIKELDESEKKKENLKELLNSCAEYVKYREDASLESYMMHISLQMDKIEKKDKESSLSLMTVHNAKGLEFPIVFIVGMEDGVFPHYMNFEEDELLEEETRLCYVAMTRAKKELQMTCSLFNFTYSGVKQMMPSRFLKDLENSPLVDFYSEIDLTKINNEHEYF